jgi:streptogramin lyase
MMRNPRFLLAGLLTAVGLLTSGYVGGFTEKSAKPPTMALLAGDRFKGAFVDKKGPAARFERPVGVATDSEGNLYVADELNRVIRKITPAGKVSTFAGTGATGFGATVGFKAQVELVDGHRLNATFDQPLAVATDSDDNVYVADSGHNAIRKIDKKSDEVSTLAVGGSLKSPSGVAVDGGTVYVTNSGARTIVSMPSTGTNHQVSVVAGSGAQGSDDGVGAAASFFYPFGIATDSAGSLYVSDLFSNTIRKITTANKAVSTFAGSPQGLAGDYANGSGDNARFNRPRGIATDRAGNVYVADQENQVIRKITPERHVTTLAGTAGQAGFKPGLLPGMLLLPAAVTVSGKMLYSTAGNAVVSINLQ